MVWYLDEKGHKTDVFLSDGRVTFLSEKCLKRKLGSIFFCNMQNVRRAQQYIEEAADDYSEGESNPATEN